MIRLVLADSEPGVDLLDLEKTSTTPTGLAYVAGAVGLVVLLVVIWAAFIRKTRDERARHYRYGPSQRSTSEQRSTNDGTDSQRGKRKRRQRRRRRNPTLSETGGLPPRRDESPTGDPP